MISEILCINDTSPVSSASALCAPGLRGILIIADNLQQKCRAVNMFRAIVIKVSYTVLPSFPGNPRSQLLHANVEFKHNESFIINIWSPCFG